MGALSWKTIVVQKCLDCGMHAPDNLPVHVLSCSNSTIKGNNGTNRILYHDKASQTITEPPMFHWWNQAFQILNFLECSPNINSSYVGKSMKDDSSDHIACVSSFLMSRFHGHDTILYVHEHNFP
jgi:hypothetical protein